MADVVEGEVADSSAGRVSLTVDLTGLINSHIDQLEHHRSQMGELREMLDSVFQNEPTYQAHDAAVKEASKVRGNTKKQLQKQPQVQDLINRIQDHKSHMKELKTALSDYLQEYASTTSSRTFETTDGQLREIVYDARLVKGSNL